jgi:hypothetical protein
MRPTASHEKITADPVTKDKTLMQTRLQPGRVILLAAGLIVATLAVYLGWTSLTAPDTASVERSLRAAGAMVMEQSSSGGVSFLYGAPRHLLVNGQDIWVYEYAAPALAELDASRISADGSTFKTNLGPFGSAVAVDYIAPPHFYKLGRVIALYVGRDAETLRLLRQVFGQPFAGDTAVAGSAILAA